MYMSSLPFYIQETMYSRVKTLRLRVAKFRENDIRSVASRRSDLHHWGRFAKGLAEMYTCDHAGSTHQMGTRANLRCRKCHMSVFVNMDIVRNSKSLMEAFPPAAPVEKDS